MAAYEEANLRRCQGLKGVPRLRETQHPGIVAHDFVPGQPLQKNMRVSDVFFRRLFELLDRIHDLEVAYIDLEKADNVLVGSDGRPYLIDFQIALRVPPALVRWCPPVRWIVRRLQKSDHYHVMKHFRRVRPDLLTSRQIARSKRKPLLVRLGNALAAPFRQIHRNFPRHA
jgi:RIO-like serine/threonine protein kinase